MGILTCQDMNMYVNIKILAQKYINELVLKVRLDGLFVFVKI